MNLLAAAGRFFTSDLAEECASSWAPRGTGEWTTIRQPSARTNINFEDKDVNKRNMSDYYDMLGDDEWSLLGSRFAHVVARNQARKSGLARFDDNWMEPRERARYPKPYRDRS